MNEIDTSKSQYQEIVKLRDLLKAGGAEVDLYAYMDGFKLEISLVKSYRCDEYTNYEVDARVEKIREVFFEHSDTEGAKYDQVCMRIGGIIKQFDAKSAIAWLQKKYPKEFEKSFAVACATKQIDKLEQGTNMNISEIVYIIHSFYANEAGRWKYGEDLFRAFLYPSGEKNTIIYRFRANHLDLESVPTIIRFLKNIKNEYAAQQERNEKAWKEQEKEAERKARQHQRYLENKQRKKEEEEKARQATIATIAEIEEIIREGKAQQ